MAAAAFSGKRQTGRALIVASSSARAQPLAAMQALGYECAEIDDPYAAAAELYRRQMVYRALVLSLASLFREEIAIIPAIKRRMPQVDIWLTHIEGRQAAFAEAIRVGANGLLGDDGLLHPMAAAAPSDAQQPSAIAPAPEPTAEPFSDMPSTEPVLSAEELRALLQENPLSTDET